MVLWGPSRTNTKKKKKKDALFIIGDMNTKVGSQEVPGVTPSSNNQETTLQWTSPDGQYRNQINYILCSWRWKSSIQSAKTRPGTDCSSDHELFIAKFRLKLKKVGKTTRPYRYDLNQIPYDCIVEVTNRFKGLGLIDRVPEGLWTEVHDIVQEAVIKNIPTKKEMQEGKDKLWGGLTNSWEEKRSKR